MEPDDSLSLELTVTFTTINNIQLERIDLMNPLDILLWLEQVHGIS